ncbi:carbon-nitrogen hydrolase [Aulographum hederae CBS 113979]|uniref:Carbon-nitrogen hydrolase n=1 Tax=Aulographum hederae CBS 113979 TaxID=1176131 RepID=A0A6G1GJB0_9PEZI|nr:carbon-nitrogen hydrolase [Aulographum hederae CBS 113979]
MKVACLQFAPKLGRVDDNIDRANGLIQRAANFNHVDWLILPEMAFSGYNFPSLEAITPFLEPTPHPSQHLEAYGITTRWAVTTAQFLKCTITVGYPELHTPSTPNTPPIRYNSTVTVSPTGVILSNYRKTHLYYTDETWASEGPTRFFAGPLGTLGPVAHGICMDINPYKFLAPWKDYEFCAHAMAAQSPLITVSMAWLTRLEAEEITELPLQPDRETLTYWLERFWPLKERAGEEPVIIVCANRCGVEGAAVYAGTSAVFRIQRGRAFILDMLGKCEERVLVVDLNQPATFELTPSTVATQ